MSLRRRLELGNGPANAERLRYNQFAPWEPLVKTVLRLKRTVFKRNPATGFCIPTIELVFWVSSPASKTCNHWKEWIRAYWRIENGCHDLRDTNFAEDASRIRKNPDIVARLRSVTYNLIRVQGCENICGARWRAALDFNLVLETLGSY